jgi:vancomycin resistance protein VanJ
MIIRAVLLLLLPWVNGPAGLARAAEEPREFTVATFNVLYENRDLRGLAATLKQAGADLVALQETNPASEAFLRRELATLYPHMLFRTGRAASDGFGFLSKAPLRHVRFLEPLSKWRGAWYVEATLGQTNLQVVNVHLATPQVGRLQSLVPIMAAFQQAEDLHAREIARIHEPITNTAPAIVLGDFNSFSFFHAPAFLVRHGWVDSFASVTPNADQQGTWEFRQGDNRWSFRIDFLFHTPDLQTVNSRILKSPASDHYPVVSRLRLASPKPSGAH